MRNLIQKRSVSPFSNKPRPLSSLLTPHSSSKNSTNPLKQILKQRKNFYQNSKKEKIPTRKTKKYALPKSYRQRPSAKRSLQILSSFSEIKGCIDQYCFGPIIGQGAYAVVRQCTHKESNTKVAIKTYQKFRLIQTERQNTVKMQIQILQTIQHPNIVKLMQVIETPQQIHLVLEYVAGTSLRKFLKGSPEKKVSEKQAKHIFRQILSAVKYCHQANISHRDLKLDNLLIDKKQNVKLIDFGFSNLSDTPQKVYCGTPSYMAPQIINRKQQNGFKADIWALGVILFVILCGTYPFVASSDKELTYKITRGHFIFPTPLTISAKSLITKLLDQDPLKRPSISTVSTEPWVQSSGIFGQSSNKPFQSLINSQSLDINIITKIVTSIQKSLGYTQNFIIHQLQYPRSKISQLYRKLKNSNQIQI